MNQPQAVPSGTVAFLFTDIEASTARWDRHRDAMQDALRRHDAILRAAIERCGGHVFKTLGDAFCAAFEHANDALNAALAAQRDIGAEDWQAINGLRVRMAVDVGQTDERDGDYFGPAVNRVARLLSAGHGGQVLVSAAVVDMATPHLSEGIGLRSLGTLPLRGIRQPETVFQLSAPGLRSAFKPLRTLQTPANNLPHRASTFVGRYGDVARIEDALRTKTLVTIVGPGGVGKTRVALEAAAELLNDMRGGAWFVDLAALADSSLVSSAVLTALGVDQTSNAPALQILLGWLNERELLLVLDNCEHLIDEVARVVSAILSRCPLVTVLATSREALNVDGEQVYRLSSLPDGEAVELFEQRAQAGNPQFLVSADNRATVQALCRRLDGIALAIELAAARLRSISLDELSRRLHLRLLVGGSRDRQARQQTMEALIDWSYELLSASERRLFSQLSVFAGGFAVDAATSVASSGGRDADEVCDALSSLVDKSLLVFESGRSNDRYRLLEPIREYARERLDEIGATDTTFDKHAKAFVATTEASYIEWDTAPKSGWLSRISCELDNIRVALDWTFGETRDVELGARLAGAASPMFLRMSLLREGIAWGERALEFSDRLDSGTAARLHYSLSMLYHNQGENASALAAARRAVELYRQTGDERGLTRALSQVAHHLSDASAEARAVSEEALRRARAIGDPRLLATTLQRCAFVYPPADIDRAREYFEEAVSLYRPLGRDDETARALGAWADAEGLAGNFEVAASIARDALAIGSPDGRMYLMNALASFYVALGDRDQATPAACEALTLGVANAHPVVTSLALLYIAAIVGDSEPAVAARLFGYADRQLRALNWKLVGPDCAVDRHLRAALQRRLSPHDCEALRESGATWTQADAVAAALRAAC